MAAEGPLGKLPYISEEKKEIGENHLEKAAMSAYQKRMVVLVGIAAGEGRGKTPLRERKRRIERMPLEALGSREKRKRIA